VAVELESLLSNLFHRVMDSFDAIPKQEEINCVLVRGIIRQQGIPKLLGGSEFYAEFVAHATTFRRFSLAAFALPPLEPLSLRVS
jgi:hypothetical protein